jgi:hypothetical protein
MNAVPAARPEQEFYPSFQEAKGAIRYRGSCTRNGTRRALQRDFHPDGVCATRRERSRLKMRLQRRHDARRLSHGRLLGRGQLVGEYLFSGKMRRSTSTLQASLKRVPYLPELCYT